MGKTMKIEFNVWQDANGTVHLTSDKYQFVSTVSGKASHERYHAKLWQHLVAALRAEGKAVVE